MEYLSRILRDEEKEETLIGVQSKIKQLLMLNMIKI